MNLHLWAGVCKLQRQTSRLAILAVVFLSNNSAVLPPQIIDNTVFTDNSIVDIDSETGDIQIKEFTLELK